MSTKVGTEFNRPDQRAEWRLVAGTAGRRTHARADASAARHTVLDHLMKPVVSEMAVDVAQECVTLHGGRGHQRSEGIEIYLRDAIGCLIGESTTDMHYSTVAYLLDLPGAEPGAP